MARTQDRSDAFMLYTQDGKEVKEIAGLLSIPEKTLYRWKSEDSGAGNDWDKARESFRRTPAVKASEMIVTAANSLETVLNDAKNSGGKIDSQALFAVNKLLEAAERLSRGQHMYPYILTMTKELTDFLEEDQPELLEQLLPALKKFGELMAKKYRRN